MDNPGEWCTYVQAAQRLHKSIGAIRQMALRGRLQRVRGNDGKALVFVADEHVRAADEQPERVAPVQGQDGALVHALEAHVETLKAQLASAEARLAAADELGRLRQDRRVATEGEPGDAVWEIGVNGLIPR